MLRDLLVHVDGGEEGRRRVQFAADLALRTDARLSGIHVTPPAEVPPRYKPSRVMRWPPISLRSWPSTPKRPRRRSAKKPQGA